MRELLPNVAEHLAPDSFLPGFLACHHTLRSGEDGNPQSAVHPRNLLLSYVDAQTRLAHPLDACKYWVLFPGVAQVDTDVPAVGLFKEFEVFDVAFGLEYLSDCALQF